MPIRRRRERLPGGRLGQPLSPNQAAIWTRVRRDPADPTLNLPLCVRITGPLSAPALAVALTELVRRHEVLRSVVRTVDSGLVQVIEPPATVRLPDWPYPKCLADITVDEVWQEILAQFDRAAARP